MRRLRPPLAPILVLALAAGLGTAVAQPSGANPPAAAPDVGHDRDHHPDHDHDPDHDLDHEHDEGHDQDDDLHGPVHAAGLEGTRLLVAEAGGATLVVLDLATGAELARFGTPGPGTVHQLPDAQLAVVVHPAEHRLTFVHSGLTEIDHGDHADLVEGLPYVLQTLNVGQRPGHWFASGNELAVFNEGDGSVAWFDRRLLGVSLDYEVLDGREPGAGAVAVQGGHAYVGSAGTGRVDVFDRTGATLATFGGCPGLRGVAAWTSGVAFGCDDGVLLVEAGPGGTFAAHEVAHPVGSPEGARVGTLAGAAHGVGGAGSEILVGDFGQGIALIDPMARSLTPVPLVASPLAMRSAEAGAVLIVLTDDGRLHAIDPASGAVLRSVAVVEAVVAGAPRPTMTVLGEHAYVADPLNAEVVEVHVERFAVERRLPVPFAPGGLAGLAIEGADRH